eukprot:7253026-Pyramimonas_sp.AAC.1
MKRGDDSLPLPPRVDELSGRRIDDDAMNDLGASSQSHDLDDEVVMGEISQSDDWGKTGGSGVKR